MKNTYLLIKEGKAFAVCEEIPKEPKYSDYVEHTKYYWQVNKYERKKRDYESALQRVKDNAILIRPEDQEKAYKTWYRSYGKGIITNTPKEGELYPLSVEVEIFHTCCNGTSTIAYCELDCEGQKHFHGDKTRKLARIVEEPVTASVKFPEFKKFTMYDNTHTVATDHTVPNSEVEDQEVGLIYGIIQDAISNFEMPDERKLTDVLTPEGEETITYGLRITESITEDVIDRLNEEGFTIIRKQ